MRSDNITSPAPALAATSTATVLLLGRTTMVLDEAESRLRRVGLSDVRLLAGTTVDDVHDAFAAETRIDHVIMGAGLSLDVRLEIIRIVFETSAVTSVHLKDSASGPDGFLPFVAGLLSGLRRAP